MFGAWQQYEPNWRDSKFATDLRRTIERMQEAGVARIILVGPTPRFIPNLPAMLNQRWNDLADIPLRLTIDRAETDAIELALSELAASLNIRYFSPLAVLCEADGCLTKVPGSQSRLLTWDYGHLTTDGANLVSAQLRRQIAGSPILGERYSDAFGFIDAAPGRR
jgi:lysophospholipase L1-like esterase